MLNMLYNDDIAIKLVGSGDIYKGLSPSDSTIKGAIIKKTSRRVTSEGVTIVTSNVLNTEVNLPLKTLITYDGADRPIQWVDAPTNHLLGTGIDHYEYGF